MLFISIGSQNSRGHLINHEGRRGEKDGKRGYFFRRRGGGKYQ